MKKILCSLLAMAILFIPTGCDDTTGAIGDSIVPEGDKITPTTNISYATSETIMAKDSILANTSDVYLGQYTDEESGTTFNSGFITQFGCTEDFFFPENGVVGDCAKYAKLRLYISDYYGDSLNAMKCEVYELDNTLIEGKPYYTNLNPEDFYDAEKEPLATKTFSVIDFTQHDTIINGNNTRHIEIELPKSIGDRFISKFYEENGEEYYANSEKFIENIFPGVYIKCIHGDGTVVKINRSRIDIGFDRETKTSAGKDTIETLSAPFYSGKEVLQTNKFDNSGLEELVENETGHTYIKTPAGLFTEITLPIIDAIKSNNKINTAKIAFTRYNEGATTTAPTTLLMVRKKEMHRFFLKNELTDNKTSYLTTFDSSTNKYLFNNISNLLNHCYEEYINGTASDPDGWESKNPDWDKVVLIPVNATIDTNGTVVKITHDTDIKSVKLRGGDSYEIPVEIVSSKFNN
ncbi:MAG: DUF4270 domain-containing protein [Bacteroidaceae bacterium]|nr:DUF4270 domain-containing protein [Bacteroidaceae bacterium]